MRRLRRLMDLFRLATRRPGRGGSSGRVRATARTHSRFLMALAAGAPEAHTRGLRLLRENLSPEQREQHEKFGYFEVIGGATGRRYRIRNGAQMNVQLLDKTGRPMNELCFLPEGELPVGDVMLAQKLALELFETEALKVARFFG